MRNRRNIVKNTISNTAYYFHLHEDYDDLAETITNMQMKIQAMRTNEDGCLIIWKKTNDYVKRPKRFIAKHEN